MKIGLLFISTSGHTVQFCHRQSDLIVSGIDSNLILFTRNDRLSNSFNQCDQVWRNFATLAKIKSLWPFFEGLFNIWKNCEPNLATFYAIGQKFIVVPKGPNIVRII